MTIQHCPEPLVARQNMGPVHMAKDAPAPPAPKVPTSTARKLNNEVMNDLVDVSYVLYMNGPVSPS